MLGIPTEPDALLLESLHSRQLATVNANARNLVPLHSGPCLGGRNQVLQTVVATRGKRRALPHENDNMLQLHPRRGKPQGGGIAVIGSNSGRLCKERETHRQRRQGWTEWT